MSPDEKAEVLNLSSSSTSESERPVLKASSKASRQKTLANTTRLTPEQPAAPASLHLRIGTVGRVGAPTQPKHPPSLHMRIGAKAATEGHHDAAAAAHERVPQPMMFMPRPSLSHQDVIQSAPDEVSFVPGPIPLAPLPPPPRPLPLNVFVPVVPVRALPPLPPPPPLPPRPPPPRSKLARPMLRLWSPIVGVFAPPPAFYLPVVSRPGVDKTWG